MFLSIKGQLTYIVEEAFKRIGLDNFPVNLGEATRPEFGDFQANGVLAAAKSLKRNPRELANEVVAAMQLPTDLVTIEIAGPGFLNFILSDAYLIKEFNAANYEAKASADSKDYKVVIDYSSPNLAKEMHVGHLRSTIIGDALARMHLYVGHTLIKRNHVGDWGTQFGMLLAFMETKGLTEGGGRLNLALSDLESFYRQAKTCFDEDAAFADRAHQLVVKLQHKDPGTFKLWQIFVKISLTHCQEIYDRLNVLLKPSDVYGESYYNDMLDGVVEDLVSHDIAVDDNGAKCVFFSDGELGDKFQEKVPPLIIQKRDGGYLYATTDLAAAYDRIDNLKAREMLYVIDARQGLYLQQMFTVLKRRGKLTNKIKIEHVAFGVMLGEDGRPFKTRTGGTVHLASLLDEAQLRVTEQLKARHQDWSAQEIAASAEKIAIAAVKYADLAKNRQSDYQFSFDQMLALEGNTAPYLLYAYVRAVNILNKAQGGAKLLELRAIDSLIERDLIKLLLKWDEQLQQAIDNSCPHFICNYLFQVATAFMRFYEQCPILREADSALVSGRLAIVKKVSENLKQGLALLGIETIEKM